jgi:hypothetical protein
MPPTVMRRGGRSKETFESRRDFIVKGFKE